MAGIILNIADEYLLHKPLLIGVAQPGFHALHKRLHPKLRGYRKRLVQQLHYILAVALVVTLKQHVGVVAKRPGKLPHACNQLVPILCGL